MVAIAVKLSEQMLHQENTDTMRQNADTMREESACEFNESHHLVIGADDMLRIREKIQSMYPGKNVILAPCLSKLYISRELKMFDFDGKTSPNWFYFSTGIVSLIYNTDDRDLSIALFDERYVRLLWRLKWADYIQLRAQTSHFYILNTKEDSSTHAGILYDNKDVAELMRNTVDVLYESIKSNAALHEVEESNKNKILRTISLRRNKPRSETMPICKEDNVNTSPSLDNSNNSGKAKFFSRDSLRRRAGLMSKSKHSSFDESQMKKVDENETLGKMNRFSRAQSFRKLKITNNNNENTCSQKNEIGHTFEKNVSEDEKETLRKRLFKLRRISRTRSLITPKTETSHDVDVQLDKEKNVETFANANQYQRTKKLVKQRASTDTLILHDKTMRYVIDAAHVARFARERKHLLKNLEKTNLQDTDLCTTEL